jgi:endoglucanase
MDRRRFLATLSALSAVGLAGCPGGGGGTDTPGETDGGDRTDTATPTGVPTPTRTSAPTATPAGETPTDSPTESETATPTEEETATPTETPQPESDLPRLHTDGKWIVDEDGNEVVLRGVATADPQFVQEDVDRDELDYWTLLGRLTDESEAWYTGVVRVPCTLESWQSTGISRYCSQYLDRIVGHCARENVYVMIDHHLIRDYDTDEIDAAMREFWGTVAPRYADRSHVLYELFNEPKNPSFPDDETTWGTWKDHAQPWVDLIRERAPETPVVIGSPEWTSVTNMAPEDPFEGENLVYSGHIYPANGQPEEFDATYGAPAEEVPVMITEFGWDANGDPDVDEGTTSGWGDPFMDWLDSYPNMGWQGWCFDPGWFPALVDDELNLLGGDSYAGHTIKDRLADRRDERTPDAFPTDGADYTGPADQTPPPVPTGFFTRETGDDEFQVTWVPSEDGETATQFYRVYVNGRRAATVEGEAYTLQAIPGQTYEIQVTAVDAVGNESAKSETVTVEGEGELDPDTEIPQAGAAPEVDGDVDDAWSNVTAHEFRHVVQGSVDGDDDLSGTWRATWDDDAFYLLVDVTDDELVSDSDQQYNDDSVEIFVDADNSKGSEYDGTNDFQFSFPWDGESIAGKHPQPVDDVEWAQTDTDDGYRIEVAFPWSVLTVSNPANHAMGLDVHVNDDDDGGERDGKMAWFGEEDVAWNTPSALATVQLVE